MMEEGGKRVVKEIRREGEGVEQWRGRGGEEERRGGDGGEGDEVERRGGNGG